MSKEKVSKIVNLINQYKNDEDYKSIIDEIYEYCENEGKTIDNEKRSIKLRNKVRGNKIIDQLNIDIEKDVYVIDVEYNRLDHYIKTYIELNVGPLNISRSYDGTNEGEGDISIYVNDKHMYTVGNEWDEYDLKTNKNLKKLYNELRKDYKELDGKTLRKFIEGWDYFTFFD